MNSANANTNIHNHTNNNSANHVSNQSNWILRKSRPFPVAMRTPGLSLPDVAKQVPESRTLRPSGPLAPS